MSKFVDGGSLVDDDLCNGQGGGCGAKRWDDEDFSNGSGGGCGQRWDERGPDGGWSDVMVIDAPTTWTISLPGGGNPQPPS